MAPGLNPGEVLNVPLSVRLDSLSANSRSIVQWLGQAADYRSISVRVGVDPPTND